MKRISWFDLFLTAIGRRVKYRVEGNSMSPALNDGDIVLIKQSNSFNIGEIVLAKHPYKQSVRILKRISAISPDGRLTLTGDNPHESTDSRVFGEIKPSDIIGMVVAKSD